MKKLFLLLAAATLVTACSKDAEGFDDFDNFPQIVDGPTIMVETPGTLAELLTRFDAEAITELTVKGNLNSSDIYALRDKLPNLAVLDMESVDLEELPGGSFYEKTSLTAVRLPKNLKTIGEYAFSDCSGLTSVVLPKNLTEIGRYAFVRCSGLTGDLVLPKNLTKIGNHAFGGCSGLTGKLVIPQGVTKIYGFSGCSGLKSVTIPQGVTKIGEWAFSGCSGLKSVTIPQGVTKIGEYAFSGCSGLTGKLVIPQGVTEIGKFAFNYCSGLTGDLVIPKNLTSIGEYAFNYCSGLTGDLVIPQGVTSIEQFAFRNCSSLTSVTFPQSMERIHRTVFYGCSNLTAIYCKGNVPPKVWRYSTETNASNEPFNYATTTLYVPIGMAETYKSAATWKKFENIVEMEF